MISQDGEGRRGRRQTGKRSSVGARAEILKARDEVAGQADYVGLLFEPEGDGGFDEAERHAPGEVQVRELKDSDRLGQTGPYEINAGSRYRQPSGLEVARVRRCDSGCTEKRVDKLAARHARTDVGEQLFVQSA